MKNSNSKFSSRATHHIYQRCEDHGVLFYTVEDRLVYYTLAASKARKHKVRVSAASLMFTHTHESLIASTLEDIRAYLHDKNTSFCRLYNARYRRKGILLERRPGCSQKVTSKDIRSNQVYVYNNHVEKGLCRRAVDERWAFLAYAMSDHPFSEPLTRNNASNALRKALNLADRRISRLKALEYSDLDKIFAVLSPVEREQFIDYVISHYALIDFSIAISRFGSLEAILVAVDSTTGGEYEIKEDHSKLKDTGYETILEDAVKNDYIKDIFTMSETQMMERIVYLSSMRCLHPDHLRRFFHCDFKITRK